MNFPWDEFLKDALRAAGRQDTETLEGIISAVEALTEKTEKAKSPSELQGVDQSLNKVLTDIKHNCIRAKE